MRKTGLSALLFVLLAVPVLPAAAQTLAPEYVESEPSDGETMHQAPDQVVVRFSEPLDESSRMEVRDECGAKIDDGNVTVNLQEMSVGIAETPSGVYKVNYYAKGIRGLTGQTMGSFTFIVHAGKSCDGSDGHEGRGNSNNNGSNEHEGHNEPGDDPNHEGHEGDGGADHSSMDHTMSPDQNTMDHSSMDHDAMSDDHSAHKKGRDKHQGHKQRPPKTPKKNVPPPQAGPDDGFGGTVEGSAVMLSLGLSLVFGVAGGWYLRTTAPR